MKTEEYLSKEVLKQDVNDFVRSSYEKRFDVLYMLKDSNINTEKLEKLYNDYRLFKALGLTT